MSDIFEIEDNFEGAEPELPTDEVLRMETAKHSKLDARRRLEKILEEKRLRDELEEVYEEEREA